MKINEYEQLLDLKGNELFLVETDEGTRVMTYGQLVDLIKEKHEEYMEEDIADIEAVIRGSASSITFEDTVDLNASNVQEAIEALANKEELIANLDEYTTGFGENEKEIIEITIGTITATVYSRETVDKLLTKYYTKTEADQRYAFKGEGGAGGDYVPVDAYTKDESDERYATKSDVANKVDQSEFDSFKNQMLTGIDALAEIVGGVD